MSDMELGLWGQGRWWNTKFWHSNQQAAMNDMSEGIRAVFSRSTERMDMISENLANSSTPGYRAGTIMPANFVGELQGRLVGHQWRTGTDLSTGAFKMTDRPLDFALQGDGFFVVRSPNGEFLTRNGSFEVTTDGTLISAAGYEVLGEDGQPLRLPNNSRLEDIQVSEFGEISVGDNAVGRLLIERVPSEQALRRVGTAMFSTAPEYRQPDENTRVIGRTLETSNTTVYQEMADMLVLNRSVEAAQRAQRTETDSQRKMMDTLS